METGIRIGLGFINGSWVGAREGFKSGAYSDITNRSRTRVHGTMIKTFPQVNDHCKALWSTSREPIRKGWVPAARGPKPGRVTHAGPALAHERHGRG